MPRHQRLPFDTQLVQVISRFCDNEFRITGDADRTEYLRRAGKSLERMDCHVLAYALMSNHVHWVLVGGRRPLSYLFRSLHSGFAAYLNRTQDRLGPVFADRFRPYTYNDAWALRLIAYVHNNPVRAGLVTQASASTWTSHRAYLNQGECPKWLHTHEGLAFSGFKSRETFDAAVLAQRQATWDIFSSDKELLHRRSAIRRAIQMPIEIAASHLGEKSTELPIMMRNGVQLVKLGVEPPRVIEKACEVVGLPELWVATKSRRALAVEARRLALLAWDHLGGNRSEMARHLRISDPAATQLVHRNKLAIAAIKDTARILAVELTCETDPKTG